VNLLSQLPNTLIASASDAAALETAEKVRLLVISDSHGESTVVTEIIRQFGEDVDALVHCGDGAADVLDAFERFGGAGRSRECLPGVIAAVQGNGDGDCFPLGRSQGAVEDAAGELLTSSAPQRLKFHLTRRLCFRCGGKVIFVTHGHGYGVDFGSSRILDAAAPLGADVILHGHTHCPKLTETPHHTLVLNPGSCTRPRGEFPPSFCVLSIPGPAERYGVEFFQVEQKFGGGFQFSPLKVVV
jgi:putative phosphoesterase